ncbi:hypothetical protein FNF29_04957 [Cafeteria roenbergensis]|uniref:G domain-containing protein n=1 Tax=Cafeteria roenbergensis TaxID=33653 RepID=A0A5A8CCH7_CAFRO|nr:hypothetical protein FNF29_04957 [Cafeteria roenbergensis]|eukprot:KAA0150843.1 hypothetical protein FNF29_04957 [Cafeteria roenbergensis]
MARGKGGRKGGSSRSRKSSGPAVSAKGQLGKSIQKRKIKDAMERKRLAREGPDLESMGLETAGSRLISVTDTNTVEDFMAAATMAERSFAAERRVGGQHDELVMLGSDGEIVAMGAGAAAEAAKPDVTDESGVMPLRVPRRPAWHEGISAKELHRNENNAFLRWRRTLADLEEEHTSAVASGAGGELGGVAVTPFEKNIEMWRQLWRVVERADVVVQVVDARQPLLYRCPDIEDYAREINPLKQSLLLVNKADYLSPRQRLEWGRHLSERGVAFAFFSAHAELKKLEDEARNAARVGMGVFSALEEGADLRIDADRASVGSGAVADGSDDEAEDEGAEAKAEADARDGAASDEDEDEDGSASVASDVSSTAGGAGGALLKGADMSAASRSAHAAALAELEAEAAAAEARIATEAAEEQAAAESLGASPELRAACKVLDREGLLDMLRDRYGWLRAHVTAGQVTEKASARLQEEADKARRRLEALDAAEAEADEFGGFSSEALRSDARAAPEEEEEEEEGRKGAAAARGDDGLEGDSEDDEPAEAAAGSAASAADGAASGVRPKRKVGFYMPGGKDAEEAEAAAAGIGNGVRWAPDVSDTAAASAALEEVEGRKLTIGTVGYPNVGKSSVINALLGVTASSHRQKRAGVGATPGKTKHFQTLHLSDDMTLCDCPGLVFPSFVSTRAEMVIAGVLPVDQMRQHIPPVSLVCQRIPRHILEGKYGIKIRKPGMVEDPHRPPHARELLDALCKMRGYMASTHAGTDQPRGSRVVLKDFLNGDLLYVHPPPGISGTRRAAFLSETSAHRGIVLGSSNVDSQMEARATELSAGGIGWADNVLLPSAAAIDMAGGDADRAAAAAAAAATSAAGGAAGDAADEAAAAAAEAPAMTAEEIAMAAFMQEDDEEMTKLVSAAAATDATGGRAGRADKRAKRAGRRARRPRKGERDPDPYGTQLTEEEMLLGVVSEAERRQRRQRMGRGEVDVRVMTGSARNPADVGPGSSFTRVVRPFPARPE